MEHADDLDSAGTLPIRARSVEDDIRSDGDASQASEKLGSFASAVRLSCERAKLPMDASSEDVGLTGAVLGNVGPNIGEVVQGPRAYDNRRHLFGCGFAGCQALAALSLHLGHAPGTRRAAF